MEKEVNTYPGKFYNILFEYVTKIIFIQHE